MNAIAPLTVLSALVASTALATTPHVPLGVTGERVQRLTLLPGPTLTSPAKGVDTEARKPEPPPFSSSYHADPEPPRFQYQVSPMTAPGTLSIRAGTPPDRAPFRAPPPPVKPPLKSDAPRFDEQLPPTTPALPLPGTK